MPDNKCPFEVGQVVYYRPSARGYGWDAGGNMPPIGAAVVIKGIAESVYLVLEGWPHPGGGNYWTEFSPD
jgi:hypothetical protein